MSRWNRRIRTVVGATVVAVALLVPAARPALAATDAEERCFIFAAYDHFWGEDPSFEAFSYWMILFDDGEPYGVLPEFLASQEPWLVKVVQDLYQAALDRPADSGGRAYWIGRLQAGALVNEFGSLVYGSQEFYERAGSSPEGFVTALYQRILGRTPDPLGLAYWTTQLVSTSRGAVAAAFFGSIESRTDRVTGLYDTLLGRAPDPGGLAYWTQRLLTDNDVALAVQLASSPEFFAKANAPGACTPMMM